MVCKVEEAVKAIYGKNALPIGLKEVFESDWRMADDSLWEMDVVRLQKVLDQFVSVHHASCFNIVLIDSYGIRREADFSEVEVVRQNWEIWKEGGGWKLKEPNGTDIYKTKEAAEKMREAVM